MRAISNVPRNVSDDMLRSLARNGGVIGINFGMGFINPRDAEKLRLATDTEAEAPALAGKPLDEYAAENAQKLFGTRTNVVATVEDVADHIDHAVKIVGIDHVGIGSDFDGIAATANGLEDVSKMPSARRSAAETRIYRDRSEEDSGRKLSPRGSRGSGSVTL